MKTKRLDIKDKHGITHFNYANRGQTYLRDPVYAYDYIRAKNTGYSY